MSGFDASGKYAGLTRHLLGLPAEQTTVTLSFRELEGIVGAPLPASARKYRPWWANQADTSTRAQTAGWMNAGFVVESVNLASGTVRFARARGPLTGRRSAPMSKGEGTRVPETSTPRQKVRAFAATYRPGLARAPAGARRIVLVACAATKLPHRAPARELYVSELFRRAMAYARSLAPDAIYILSAKHGLVDLDTMLDPYNLTLKDLSSQEARAWSERVLGQLGETASLENDHFIILAGDAYRRYLIARLSHWEAPLEGLPIGKQLQRLGELLHGEPLR